MQPVRSAPAAVDRPLVYERLSDPILVRRAKDGDRAALAALAERHAPRVQRIALHLLRDPEDARDAAQESLARRDEPLQEDLREAHDGDPVTALAARETRRELGRCLAELPPAQAQVVALKDAFELPFEDVARMTGLPVGTAKCYAHRGRNGLRTRLSA